MLIPHGVWERDYQPKMLEAREMFIMLMALTPDLQKMR